MRKELSKRFEVLVSIAVIAGFTAVAMFLNWSKPSEFAGRHGLENATDVGTIRDRAPVYAKSVWQGRAIWAPVAFAQDGVLPIQDLVAQMYEKTFPKDSGFRIQDSGKAQSSSVNRQSTIREGPHSADELPHWVHVVARHHDGPAPTGLVFRRVTYKSVKAAQDAWDAAGTVFLDHWGHNLRVNAGINWQFSQMGGTPGAACTYIALTNSAITPAATDTSLSGEITNNGLARALATATHSSNATTYTLPLVFTATATQAAQAAAVFNASSGPTMCFENTFTQASLVANDTLTVTWTITF